MTRDQARSVVARALMVQAPDHRAVDVGDFTDDADDVLDALGWDGLVDAERLAALLKMSGPPPTVDAIARRACSMLNDERIGRLVAEADLELVTAERDRARALAAALEEDTATALAGELRRLLSSAVDMLTSEDSYDPWPLVREAAFLGVVP